MTKHKKNNGITRFVTERVVVPFKQLVHSRFKPLDATGSITYEPQRVQALIESISERGLTEPPHVWLNEDGKHEHIGGHHKAFAFNQVYPKRPVPCELYTGMTLTDVRRMYIEENRSDYDATPVSFCEAVLAVVLDLPRDENLRALLGIPDKNAPHMRIAPSTIKSVKPENGWPIGLTYNQTTLFEAMKDELRITHPRTVAQALQILGCVERNWMDLSTIKGLGWRQAMMVCRAAEKAYLGHDNYPDARNRIENLADILREEPEYAVPDNDKDGKQKKDGDTGELKWKTRKDHVVVAKTNDDGEVVEILRSAADIGADIALQVQKPEKERRPGFQMLSEVEPKTKTAQKQVEQRVDKVAHLNSLIADATDWVNDELAQGAKPPTITECRKMVKHLEDLDTALKTIANYRKALIPPKKRAPRKKAKSKAA